MAIRSVSPDPTSRKRPNADCSDTTSGSKRRRTDTEHRTQGLFEKVRLRSPISVIDPIQSREVGMGPISFDPLREIEKGKRLLEEGKIDEAKRAFCFAKHSAVLNHNFVLFLIQIGNIEYDHELYADSLETFQLLAQHAPSYRELAHLNSGLCYFHLRNRAECQSLLSHFAEQWVTWMMITPISCPLSSEDYAIYSSTVDWSIPRLKAIHEKLHQEIEESLDEAPFVEADNSIVMALFYLSLAQNNLDEVNQIIDTLELDESVIFMLIYDLKNSDVEQKSYAFERAKHMLIRWEIGRFAELITIKLLFSEGLKSKDPRPLQCARRNFLDLEARMAESHFKLPIKTWIFFCHLALEQYEQAQEVKNSIELLQPGSVALLSTLCRLHQAETLTQDILDDLKNCLETKDENTTEPSILQFIGDFILEKEMNLSLLPDPGLTPALIPLSREFYQWASSFHGQRNCDEMALDFFWSQVSKFRDLYRQNRFDAALIQGQKLCKASINNEFLLLEVALCWFQLGRSQVAIQQLHAILNNKIESEDGDFPYVDEMKLAECIPWLRSAGADQLAQEYEEWVEEVAKSDFEESLEPISEDERDVFK